MYCDGVGFYLSDHFALVALVDVHELHGQGMHAGRFRRSALCRHRDAEVAEEVGFGRVRDLAGRRDSVFEKGEALERQAGDVREQALALVRVRSKRFEQLRCAAYGPSSLFGERVPCGGVHDGAVDGAVQRFGDIAMGCVSVLRPWFGGVAVERGG